MTEQTLNPPQRCTECECWTGAVGTLPVKCTSCLMDHYWDRRRRGGW